MYRKGGLLVRDSAERSITITAKGKARLAFAEKYLTDRGFQL
jgi:hypothetical protein